jgi:hypothetical protein
MNQEASSHERAVPLALGLPIELGRIETGARQIFRTTNQTEGAGVAAGGDKFKSVRPAHQFCA